MVCEGLEIFPTVGLLFFFYATKPLKGSWITKGGLVRNSHFIPYSNQYKGWKDKIIWVRGVEGSRVMVGVDGAPLFPLAWKDKLVVIAGYDDK